MQDKIIKQRQVINFKNVVNTHTHTHKTQSDVQLPSCTYFWLDTVVISGNDNSRRTCSWSSTTYTPVQLTAIITSFFGRFGPGKNMHYYST